MDVTAEFVAFVGGLGVGVANDLLRSRGSRTADRLGRARQAVDELLGPLRDLRALARESAHRSAAGAEWSGAMTAFVDAWDGVGHRLPRDARHLRHSVRACVGEYVGGPAAADLDPRLGSLAAADHHPEWRAHAEDYLEHAVHGLQRWQERPTGRPGRRTGISGFDEWLAGRRWN